MALNILGLKRALLDPVTVPEAKATIQPVSKTAAATQLPAQTAPVGSSFAELLGGQFGGNGYWDAINPMFAKLGYSDFLQAMPEFSGAGDSVDYSAWQGNRVKQSVLDDLAAKGYTVDKRVLPGDEVWLDLYQGGNKLDSYKAQNKSSAIETFMENGGALAIPFMAAGLFDPNGLMGAIGMGGEAAAIPAVDLSTIGTSIAPMTAAEVVAGAPALSLLEAAPILGAAGSAGLGATSIAPMTAAEVVAGAPLTDAGILASVDALPSISSIAPAAITAPTSIAPMTPAQVAAGAPVTDAAIASSVGSLPTSVAAPAMNSVLADSAAGSAGYGASSAGAGGAANAATSGLGGALTNVYDFLKTNPALGKLLFSGASGLLSGLGSSGGGSSQGEPVYGSPVQWNSSLTNPASLLSPVQPTSAPGAIQSQGAANSGAWRYLRGQ